MPYTDNPIADFNAHNAKCERELEKFPVCAECDHPIQDDEYYEIDGIMICPTCLKDNHRKWTEDYINEE